MEHLAAASGVGAIVHADAIPTAPGYEAACKALSADPNVLALSGGEDYELLFTAPASSEAAALGTPIGEIVEGAGARVLDASGSAIEIGRTGFRHFS